ncbi:MAG TPA: hypothetical protein VEU53_13285 [Stellaceae bacterium]|nr:hypothetical protein [Stellaceae bacterium]
MGRNVDGQGLATLGGHGVKKEQTATVVHLFERAAPERGDDVERINQYSFYQFGNALSKLEAIEGDIRPGHAFITIMEARRHLDGLLQGKPVPLRTSRAAAEALLNYLKSISHDHFYKVDDKGESVFTFPSDDDPPIEAWRWNYVRTLLTTFEHVFSAEMAESTTYFVPRRGIYFTPDLVDCADQSFPDEIVGHIPAKAKGDWRSAGRCLAFNLLTASGFHVARAVEATLETYYQLFTGNNDTLSGWYDYIKALEEIPEDASPRPAEKTLSELRQMKDDYRNPVMHPRVSLSDSDARMLFDNGESLIIAMAGEIKNLRETGVQTGLAIVQPAAATILTGALSAAAANK